MLAHSKRMWPPISLARRWECQTNCRLHLPHVTTLESFIAQMEADVRLAIVKEGVVICHSKMDAHACTDQESARSVAEHADAEVERRTYSGSCGIANNRNCPSWRASELATRAAPKKC